MRIRFTLMGLLIAILIADGSLGTIGSQLAHEPSPRLRRGADESKATKAAISPDVHSTEPLVELDDESSESTDGDEDVDHFERNADDLSGMLARRGADRAATTVAPAVGGHDKLKKSEALLSNVVPSVSEDDTMAIIESTLVRGHGSRQKRISLANYRNLCDPLTKDEKLFCLLLPSIVNKNVEQEVRRTRGKTGHKLDSKEESAAPSIVEPAKVDGISHANSESSIASLTGKKNAPIKGKNDRRKEDRKAPSNDLSSSKGPDTLGEGSSRSSYEVPESSGKFKIHAKGHESTSELDLSIADRATTRSPDTSEATEREEPPISTKKPTSISTDSTKISVQTSGKRVTTTRAPAQRLPKSTTTTAKPKTTTHQPELPSSSTKPPTTTTTRAARSKRPGQVEIYKTETIRKLNSGLEIKNTRIVVIKSPCSNAIKAQTNDQMESEVHKNISSSPLSSPLRSELSSSSDKEKSDKSQDSADGAKMVVRINGKLIIPKKRIKKPRLKKARGTDRVIEIDISHEAHGPMIMPATCDKLATKQERLDCYARKTKLSQNPARPKKHSKGLTKSHGPINVNRTESISEVKEMHTETIIINKNQAKKDDLPEIVIKKIAIKHLRKRCRDMKGSAKEQCIEERRRLALARAAAKKSAAHQDSAASSLAAKAAALAQSASISTSTSTKAPKTSTTTKHPVSKTTTTSAPETTTSAPKVTTTTSHKPASSSAAPTSKAASKERALIKKLSEAKPISSEVTKNKSPTDITKAVTKSTKAPNELGLAGSRDGLYED